MHKLGKKIHNKKRSKINIKSINPVLEAKEVREIQRERERERERETNENEALVRLGGALHAAEEFSHDVHRLYIFQCYRARHFLLSCFSLSLWFWYYTVYGVRYTHLYREREREREAKAWGASVRTPTLSISPKLKGEFH